MKNSYTVLIDTRERIPLLFPANLVYSRPGSTATDSEYSTVAVNSVSHKLNAGDYALLENPTGVVIERKGSIEEVAKNCTSKADRPRFLNAIRRFADSCERPFLLFEGDPHKALRPTRHVMEPGVAFSHLTDILMELNIGLLFLPSNTVPARRAIGEMVARLLISGRDLVPLNSTEGSGRTSERLPASRQVSL